MYKCNNFVTHILLSKFNRGISETKENLNFLKTTIIGTVLWNSLNNFTRANFLWNGNFSLEGEIVDFLI